MKPFCLPVISLFFVAAVSCASEPETGVPEPSAGSTARGGSGNAGGKGGVSGSAGQATGGTGTSRGGGAGAGAGGSMAGGGGSAGKAGASGSNMGGSSSGQAGAGGKAAGGGAGVGGSNGGSGGAAGSGGGAGNGGAPNAGSGGGSAGGAAGSNGGGGKAPVVASPGCGKGGRPSGGNVTVAGKHIYTFPADYDGSTPYPLVFGFHANGNPIDQIQTLTEDSELPNQFVMAFPKSAGQGWVLNTDRQHIQEIYDELLNSHCIDTNRVFATGHSSGAQLIVQFMCADDQRFTAIAPVASSVYCNGWDPIPTLLIHGRNDTERGSTSQDADGKKDLAPYVSSNGCGTSTMPKTVSGCSSSGTQVMPGCVEYQGCSEPLTWCSHNDPFYSGTNHGWPCFASDLMYEFFSTF